MKEKVNTKFKLISFLDAPYEIQLETRNWRNSSEVAKYFKIPYITEEMHKNWLNSLQEQNPRNIAFLINANDENIGVTYFHSIDYKKLQADWGIYISKISLRGGGLGKQALLASVKYAQEKLKLKTLFLDVLNTNTAAIKLYEKIGFKIINSDENNFSRYSFQLNNSF